MFWLIGGELLTFPFDGSHSEGIAKSGDTYNHQKLWEHVRPKGCRCAFDYYLRGRVDINNKGNAVIYMSPHIGSEYLGVILRNFDVQGACQIRYDHSRHYHCAMDPEERKGKLLSKEGLLWRISPI